MSAPVAHLFHHDPTDLIRLSLVVKSESNHWLQPPAVAPLTDHQCGVAGFGVHHELRSVNDSMISTTDHLLIGLRASQPVTIAASPGSGCSVPFDRLWSPFPGPPGSVSFWAFLAVLGPTPLKQIASSADAAQLLYASAAAGGHHWFTVATAQSPGFGVGGRHAAWWHGAAWWLLFPTSFSVPSCPVLCFTASLGVLSQISISLFSLFSSI